jgi:RNA polymerase sigma factor (sigma-70 family)
MKEVSSQELETAFNQQDNFLIIHKVLAKFNKQLDKDVLRQCGMVALWKCIQKHDATKQKFTSSLYNLTRIECFNALSRQYSKRKQHTASLDAIKEKASFKYDELKILRKCEHNDRLSEKDITPKLDIELILSKLNDVERSIIIERYIDNRKLEDIAAIHKKSRQWVQLIIKQTFQKIRDIFGVYYY